MSEKRERAREEGAAAVVMSCAISGSPTLLHVDDVEGTVRFLNDVRVRCFRHRVTTFARKVYNPHELFCTEHSI